MILTLDIGGTQIKSGLFQFENISDFIETKKYDTNIIDERFDMLSRLDEIIKEFIAIHSLEGVAISSAGVVDSKSGEIIYANKNIPNYIGTDLSKFIQEKYGLKSAVENDVNCALIGEMSLKKYSGIESAVMLTIGTGVGGAIFLNGKIYNGYLFSAGEVGYTQQNEKNIEEIASTTALVKIVSKKVGPNFNEKIDGRWIFDKAINENNQICIESIQEIIRNIAILINNIASILNPEVVILGGGIMEQKDYIHPILIKELDKIMTNKLVKSNLRVEFAELGNKAGMIGAFINYKNKIGI